MLFGLDGIGLWPTYLQWKKNITLINEEIAAQYQQAPLPLWDFAVINTMTREWLPEDPRLTAPRNGMQWFWDPAHARPAFGDEIQQRVFVTGTQDIGEKLTSATIEQHLQQQTAALAQAQQDDATIREHIKQNCSHSMCGNTFPAKGIRDKSKPFSTASDPIFLLTAHKPFIQFSQADLYPCWASMIALPTALGNFHIAQQRVHFWNGHASIGTHRTVTGHRR